MAPAQREGLDAVEVGDSCALRVGAFAPVRVQLVARRGREVVFCEEAAFAEGADRQVVSLRLLGCTSHALVVVGIAPATRAAFRAITRGRFAFCVTTEPREQAAPGVGDALALVRARVDEILR